MKRNIVIATTSILYLCSSVASAQQTQPTQQAPTQQVQPTQQGQAGQPARPDTSGASGAPGTSGASGQPPGPVAGRSVLGVTVVEMEAVIIGWSARKDLLGKTVVNDTKEKIGKIDDIIITPDNAAAFAIIGVGGFLGIGKHDVAIPFQQLKLQNGQLVLPGATKDALKALPRFDYAPRKK